MTTLTAHDLLAAHADHDTPIDLMIGAATTVATAFAMVADEPPPPGTTDEVGAMSILLIAAGRIVNRRGLSPERFAEIAMNAQAIDDPVPAA